LALISWQRIEILVSWQCYRWFLASFKLHMPINGIFELSAKILTSPFNFNLKWNSWSATVQGQPRSISQVLISLLGAIFWRFEDFFTWAFHGIGLESAIFIFLVCFAYLPINCHVSPPTVITSTRFEVDMTCLLASYSVFPADMLWSFDLDLLPLNSGLTLWVIWSTPTTCKHPMASPSWVMSYNYSICYNWQCICSHCVCTEPLDLCVCGKFSPCIWNPWPRFVSRLCNFCGSGCNTLRFQLIIRCSANAQSSA